MGEKREVGNYKKAHLTYSQERACDSSGLSRAKLRRDRALCCAFDHEGGGEDGRQRFATFTDPDGNVLAYFEANESSEAHG